VNRTERDTTREQERKGFHMVKLMRVHALARAGIARTGGFGGEDAARGVRISVLRKRDTVQGMSLDAIGIIAQDCAASVAFYALLGVDFKQAGGAEHFEASTPSGVRLMLDSVALIKSFHPEWKKPSGSGVILCFKQASATDVDRLYAKLTAGHRGVKEPWDAFWGQRYACVLDPDGNQIDLFAPLKN
jgi:uncharacterized glyoxalase superfamily protein PhnB